MSEVQIPRSLDTLSYHRKMIFIGKVASLFDRHIVVVIDMLTKDLYYTAPSTYFDAILNFLSHLEGLFWSRYKSIFVIWAGVCVCEYVCVCVCVSVCVDVYGGECK